MVSVSSTDAMSPTITSPALATGAGVVLGTAACMSPEQARGRGVDKRADIWAFGVVFYEMLTGQRPFQGETNLDVLAQVVHKEPDLELVPAHLRRLLRRCLEKDPKTRLRDITGVELLLEEPAIAATAPSRLTLAAWLAAGVLAIAVSLVTWTLWPAPPADQPAPEFTLEAPPESEFTFLFPGAAVSRDGRMLVFAAQRSSTSVLWLRSIDSVDARAIPGTEGSNFPFLSPDGKSVAFASVPPLSDRALKRTDLVGGAPQQLCDATDFEGGDWSRQGVILFSARGIIHQVSPSVVGAISSLSIGTSWRPCPLPQKPSPCLE